MGSTKKGWSYSVGERGRNRVRAFGDNKTGMIMLEFYEGRSGRIEPARRRVSLGHRDRNQAKQQADEAAAKLGKAEPLRPQELTLQTLFESYLGEVTLTKSRRIQSQDHQQSRLFLECFGPNRKPQHLSRREWDLFIRERSNGRLGSASRRGRGVGPRTVEKDLRWLSAVLNWATQVSDGQGGYLLDRNPCRGFPFPREQNPNRPILSREEYGAIRAVAGELDWRFFVALILAHETGHRIGAIRLLRWSDVDLPGSQIRWRKENDKVGVEHTTPLPQQALEGFSRAREKNPSIGESWVLPSPTDPCQPCSRHLLRDWWLRAERFAGLEHQKGMGFHSLRRRFATDLQHQPLGVLTQLGGWKTHRTVVECYQRPSQEDMRIALEARRRAGSGG